MGTRDPHFEGSPFSHDTGTWLYNYQHSTKFVASCIVMSVQHKQLLHGAGTGPAGPAMAGPFSAKVET